MNAIDIEDVWKRYYVYADRQNTLKSALLSRVHHSSARTEFWALRGVTLHLAPGRTVGIIGNNGAGKSTLLRLLSGLGRPTRGAVHFHGRLSTLLELGTGFNREVSGRDNVFTSGIVSGFTRREVAARFSDIVDFADLWDFIDAPVRTYSSGMFVRLAFATAINLDPDIVIVDEVLAVGDLRFQEKCLTRLRELRQAGKTVVVVSHAMAQIEELCDEVIWLEAGTVRAHGTASEVIEMYRSRLAVAPEHPIVVGEVASADAATVSRQASSDRATCRIVSVVMYNQSGSVAQEIASGDGAIFEICFAATAQLHGPIFSLGIFQEDGTKCYEATTDADSIDLGTMPGGGMLRLACFEMHLMRGMYYVDAGIYAPNWDHTYDYQSNIAQFMVAGHTPGSGVVLIPHRWSLPVAD